MVSTRIGAEGLDFEEDREILLHDDDEGFAEACVRLLRDAQASTEMGLAARIRMQNLYEASRAIRNLIIDQVEKEAGSGGL